MCAYILIIEWSNAICSNMDGPRDCHTKWSKKEKHKYHAYQIWNLKYDTMELIYGTFTDTETKLVAAEVGMAEGWSESLGLANANCYV